MAAGFTMSRCQAARPWIPDYESVMVLVLFRVIQRQPVHPRPVCSSSVDISFQQASESVAVTAQGCQPGGVTQPWVAPVLPFLVSRGLAPERKNHPETVLDLRLKLSLPRPPTCRACIPPCSCHGQPSFPAGGGLAMGSRPLAVDGRDAAVAMVAGQEQRPAGILAVRRRREGAVQRRRPAVAQCRPR